jgi:hypothetical protein
VSDPPRLLTAEQVAERLGMSKWFVYSRGRELGLVMFGSSNRYRADRVDEYLAARLADPPEAPRPAAAPAPPPRRQPAPGRGRRRRVPLLEPDTDLTRTSNRPGCG